MFSFHFSLFIHTFRPHFPHHDSPLSRHFFFIFPFAGRLRPQTSAHAATRHALRAIFSCFAFQRLPPAFSAILFIRRFACRVFAEMPSFPCCHFFHFPACLILRHHLISLRHAMLFIFFFFSPFSFDRRMPVITSMLFLIDFFRISG